MGGTLQANLAHGAADPPVPARGKGSVGMGGAGVHKPSRWEKGVVGSRAPDPSLHPSRTHPSAGPPTSSRTHGIPSALPRACSIRRT